MIYWSSLTFFVVFDVVLARYGDFTLGLLFQDDPNLVRQFLIDTASNSAFVISDKQASKFARDQIFLSNESSTYKELSRSYQQTYGHPLAPHYVDTKGSLGEDVVHFNPILSVKAKFGVVHEQSHGWPSQGLNGKINAGRLGFGRGKDASGSSLRQELVKRLKNQVFCLAKQQKNGTPVQTVSFGSDLSTKHKIIVQEKAWEDEPDHWVLPIEKFSVDDQEIPRIIMNFAVIANTKDGMVIPKVYFTKLVAALGGRQVDGQVEVSCSRNDLPILRFRINGKDVIVDAKDFLWKKFNGHCTLEITQTDEPYFVIGAPLFERTGVCFNYQTNDITFFEPNN